MKKYLFLIVSIITGLFLPLKNYVELNHLMIVESIGIDCNNEYKLYLKEIIPEKGNNDINYKYKIYEGNGKSINISYKEILNNSNKKVFIKDTKTIITNCLNTKEILSYLNIKPKNIIYTKKDIKKELKY